MGEREVVREWVVEKYGGEEGGLWRKGLECRLNWGWMEGRVGGVRKQEKDAWGGD